MNNEMNCNLHVPDFEFSIIKLMATKKLSNGVFFAMSMLLAAFVQLSIILERTVAAGWAWYAFSGYGKPSPVTVHFSSQVIFLVVSAFAFLVGLLSYRASGSSLSALVRSTFRYSIIAIFLGIIWWSVLLVTPLVLVIR